ncbi:MAG TPA: phage holin family protein [Opitutaceae bacterium]|nr:phage holin family protein [Opitutaceae bacterium]HND60100.1 phage holin family protein [Opitutaceae bacterium]
MMSLLIRWLVLALGVTLATKIVPGISCADGTTLFVVVVLLSFFNAILKPIIMLFTLPFIVLTMGLGIVLINAMLFYWAGSIVQGFHVASFWAAIWGGVTVSVTNVLLNLFIKPRPPRPPKQPKRDDVIDI